MARRGCGERGCCARDAGDDETVEALHRFLRRPPRCCWCVALTDAVGDRAHQNQPGTSTEYPNWQVPLSGPRGRHLLLEDVFRDRRAAALADAMRAATGGGDGA